MKKLILYAVLSLVSLNLICAVINYTAIDHQTLPVYSGPLSDPGVRIVYEDSKGIYVFVEYDGVLYVSYL
jgi:hypothetical protein